MITELDAVALMREANPVPDLNSYDIADPGVAAYLTDLEQGSSNVTQIEIKQESKAQQDRQTSAKSPRTWLVAAAVVVVAVGVGLFMSRGGDEVAGPTGLDDLVGTWDYVLDEELAKTVVVANGFINSIDEVTIRLGFFEDQVWWAGFLYDGELDLDVGVPEGDGGTFEVDGDQLVLTQGQGQRFDTQGQVTTTYDWELDGNELTLTWVSQCWLTTSSQVCAEDRAKMAEDDPLLIPLTENTFTKSSDDPSF